MHDINDCINRIHSAMKNSLLKTTRQRELQMFMITIYWRCKYLPHCSGLKNDNALHELYAPFAVHYTVFLLLLYRQMCLVIHPNTCNINRKKVAVNVHWGRHTALFINKRSNTKGMGSWPTFKAHLWRDHASIIHKSILSPQSINEDCSFISKLENWS